MTGRTYSLLYLKLRNHLFDAILDGLEEGEPTAEYLID